MKPYKNIEKSNWKLVTEKLVNEHPLSEKEIVEVVLLMWLGAVIDILQIKMLVQ